jgi:hypothetical protein
MDKESVPVLHKVLELDPENKPARLQLLSYAIRNNNLDEMIRIAKPALEYNPDELLIIRKKIPMRLSMCLCVVLSK